MGKFAAFFYTSKTLDDHAMGRSQNCWISTQLFTQPSLMAVLIASIAETLQLAHALSLLLYLIWHFAVRHQPAVRSRAGQCYCFNGHSERGNRSYRWVWPLAQTWGVWLTSVACAHPRYWRRRSSDWPQQWGCRSAPCVLGDHDDTRG